MEKLIRAIDENSSTGVPNFWPKINKAYTLMHIKVSWDEMPQSTLNSRWRHSWNFMVYDFSSFSNNVESVERIMNMAKIVRGEDFKYFVKEDMLDSFSQTQPS